MNNAKYIFNILFGLISIFKDTENFINMDNNKEVISRLKFISCINAGEKINVKYMFVQQDDIATKISRTIYNKDNRKNCISFVKNTIDRSFELIQMYTISDKDSDHTLCLHIIEDLKKSIKGLTNLKETYVTDMKFCCDIDVLIEDIQAKIKERERDKDKDKDKDKKKEK